MTIEIIDPVGAAGRVQLTIPNVVCTEISYEDAQVAMEEIARILGFSLVDHVERRSLIELVEEVRYPERLAEPNIHLVRSQCSWRRTAEALATAVDSALRTGEDEGPRGG